MKEIEIEKVERQLSYDYKLKVLFIGDKGSRQILSIQSF